MVGLVKRCCLVCRWWDPGSLWPVGPKRWMVRERVVSRWPWWLGWELEWWDPVVPVAGVVVDTVVSH